MRCFLCEIAGKGTGKPSVEIKVKGFTVFLCLDCFREHNGSQIVELIEKLEKLEQETDASLPMR